MLSKLKEDMECEMKLASQLKDDVTKLEDNKITLLTWNNDPEQS